MNINIGDGFSANINTIDQKVEIDYQNVPIESASFSSIGNFFSSIGTHIANFSLGLLIIAHVSVSQIVVKNRGMNGTSL